MTEIDQSRLERFAGQAVAVLHGTSSGMRPGRGTGARTVQPYRFTAEMPDSAAEAALRSARVGHPVEHSLPFGPVRTSESSSAPASARHQRRCRARASASSAASSRRSVPYWRIVSRTRYLVSFGPDRGKQALLGQPGGNLRGNGIRGDGRRSSGWWPAGQQRRGCSVNGVAKTDTRAVSGPLLAGRIH